MIKLYIENREVDLSDSIDLALTYQATDLVTPTVTKNSFSKTLTIPGTPTNNAIFGDIWKLDRRILDSATSSVGVYFDATKRVDFILDNNCEIIERGYIQLTAINIANNVVSYSVSLYGGIGDFFYSLMYDEDGEEKTLADLWYGFTDASGNIYTAEEEKYKPVMKWNSDYIYTSWGLLNRTKWNEWDANRTVDASFGYKPAYSPLYWITAAPTYSGYYDDFDNNKVLINVDTLEEGTEYFPKAIGDYSIRKGWALAEYDDRDMTEWEVRDLRSTYQRPAVKWQLIAEAVSNPANNGGYTVEWDDDVIKTDYYKYSYVLMDRIDFEGSAENEVTNIEFEGEQQSYYMDAYVTVNGDKYLDLTDYDDAKLKLNLTSIYDFGMNVDSNYYTAYKFYYFGKGYFYYLGGNLITITVRDSSNNVISTEQHIITTKIAEEGRNNATGFTFDWNNRKISGWKEYAKTKYGVTDDVILDYVTLKKYTNQKYITSPELSLLIDLPSEKGVTVEIQSVQLKIIMDETTGAFSSFITPRIGSRINDRGNCSERYFTSCTTALASVSQKESSEGATLYNGLQNGDISPDIQKENLSKYTLFANGATPYDYLIGFTKQLNLRFEVDPPTKTIRILRMKNYYTNKVVDLTDKIDHSQTITVTPTLVNSKWYYYGLETPETYASYLYNKKNTVDYGCLKLNTNYFFNNDTNDLYSDIKYKNIIDYRLKSELFNLHSGVPAIAVPSTFKYTLWNGSESSETELNGLMAQEGENHRQMYDEYAKVCCFDDSMENVSDIDNAFVFFSHYKSLNRPVLLSDNIEAMYELNDSTPCYMYSDTTTGYKSIGDSKTSTICRRLNALPAFDRYMYGNQYNNVILDSWDFVPPTSTFTTTIQYPQNSTLYQRFWKNYISDIYSKNGKSVDLYCILPYQPRRAMKIFYYFENCYWILNKVSNYNPTKPHTPVKCTFAKIESMNNYLTDSVSTIVWVGGNSDGTSVEVDRDVYNISTDIEDYNDYDEDYEGNFDDPDFDNDFDWDDAVDEYNERSDYYDSRDEDYD